MIFDQTANLSRYPFLQQIAQFDFSNYQKGRFTISSDDFFGIGLEYDTREASECLWEAHRTYLDVHYILEGEEIINITDISAAVVTKEYDPEGDYGLFEGQKQQAVHLKPGMFLVLYPNEVHQTAIQVSDPIAVRKIVFKIKL